MSLFKRFGPRVIKGAAVTLSILIPLCILLIILIPHLPIAFWVHVYLARGKFSECSLLDVVKARKKGPNPTDPKIVAAMRIVKYDGDLKLVSTPLGEFWVPARDFNDLAIELTEQSSSVYDVAGHGVRSGDVVLDCGAHVGVFARHALALGAKKVIEIEPAPEAIASLRRNLATEIQAGKVIVVPKGVWDSDGELPFLMSGESWSSRVVSGPSREGPTIKVPLTTIDRIVADLQLDRVDFIKMDIEGAERKALYGAKGTMVRFHPRMAVALEHLKNDPEEIPPIIRTLAPGMRTQCGPCSLQIPSGRARVQPQVVMAY